MTNEIAIEIEVINEEDRKCIDQSPLQIDLLNVCDLDYATFFNKYMLHNIPCMIKNVSNSWKCSQDWVKDNIINYDHFINQYGDFEAPVANCDRINFNVHCKTNMKVKDYMNYLKSEHKENLLYLKDWHLRRQTNEKFYEVPKFFANDWLNEYALDNNDDDFMFVYIGVKDTWTPFHADVYLSYSWSVNVSGRKKWVLFPPGEEIKLKDSFGNLPLLFNQHSHENIKCVEVIQEKGDGIFIPSGWHHQVFNLQDTISINHNFINGCNVELVWQALKDNLLSVEKEIEEFQETPDFLSQCQLILKSIFGMDLESFIQFIIHISQKRINHMQYLLFNNYILGKNHADFDLNRILKVINHIENYPMMLNTAFQNSLIDLLQIKNTIIKFIN